VTRSGSGTTPLRRLLVVAAAALIPVLAGCQAGDNAPTLKFHYPTDAAGTTAGDISIRNVFVLGPQVGSTLAPGQSASLFFVLVNTGTTSDRLTSITTGAATSVRLPAGGVGVGINQTVLVSGPQPRAFLVGLTSPLRGGTNITLKLHFLKAGTVTLTVPVVPRAASYVTYGPPPSPSPTPTATPAHRRHHKAAASASPSPSPTTSP
jgi:copper(I)-binding protein